MAGKYAPLENYLRDLPLSQSEVTLGFEQIEEILNNNCLPPRTKTKDGGNMRPKAIIGTPVHGPMQVGGLEVWMSTGSG